MPDSQETRVLKDINRHLGTIVEQGTDVEGGGESQALKAMGEMVGNFQSILDARLQKLVLTSDRAFNNAFGNLQGFNEEQNNEMISELDNVIDELQMSNRFLRASDDLEFLKEQERAEDLKINRRTNDILEDILEKEPGEGEGDMFGGGGGALGGLAGLGMAGLGLAQLKKIFSKGGLLLLGKMLGGAVLGGLLLKPFFEGFAEGPDGKAFTARLASGIGKMLEDFSFGIFTQKSIEEIGDKIRARMIVAGADIQKAWDDYWQGGKPLSDAMAETISGLSLGTLSPEVVKALGKNAKFFAEETGETFWRSVFSAMGFKVKPRVTLEQKKAAEENRKIEEARRKEFKERQKIVPQLERLFKEAKTPFEERARIREMLGGKFAFLTDVQKKEMAAGLFGSAEGAEKEQARIGQARVTFIKAQMEMLQHRIDREKFLQGRRDKSAADELKAAEDKVKSDKMAQQRIEEMVKQEEALRDALKRTGQTGETGNQIFQQNNQNLVPTPDTTTETDDQNFKRVPDATGMYPPIF